MYVSGPKYYRIKNVILNIQIFENTTLAEEREVHRGREMRCGGMMHSLSLFLSSFLAITGVNAIKIRLPAFNKWLAYKFL